MPQFGTFDLGAVLRDAEQIKGYQRQSKLDDLREIAMREGIETQRFNRDMNQRQFDAAQQRSNTEQLLNGIRLVKSNPNLLPTLAGEFAKQGILSPDSIPQLVQSSQTNPEQFMAGLSELEGQLQYALSEPPEKPEEAKPFTLSPGQTRFDAEGKPIASLDDPEAALSASLKAEERITKERQTNLENEEGLRKEFNDLTKDFRKVSEAYSRVQASAENPSAAGDLALIFNYMKMLDPGSTVREGEFANAQNSGGVGDTIIARYNQIRAGERLSDKIRADFLERSSSLYNAQFGEARKTADQYVQLAKKANVDADSVIATMLGKEPQNAQPAANTPTLRYNPQTGKLEQI